VSDVLRIGNCSAFFGDRIEAAREMVEGGPLDVLTGDYLAELTLAILARKKMKAPGTGYAQTFVRQLGEIAETCKARGIRIVVNAGGLDPAACAEACREVYRRLGLRAEVAHLEGDDLLGALSSFEKEGQPIRHMRTGEVLTSGTKPILTANAYLGAFGIARALDEGADLVICPRVTDASVVVGPAVHRFGWARDDWDRLASAVVAGHILECGPQATGGNYTRFEEVPGLEHPGFPIAEMAADGSFVVTKHEGTGGLVSRATVSAQVLYEIGGHRYMNPDVVARFDTIELEEVGEDRVRVHGVRGEPAPKHLKVSAHRLAGYRNRVGFVFRGARVAEKARLAERAFVERLGGTDGFQAYYSELEGDDPFGVLSVGVRDADASKVGRAFTNRAVELATANYPGMILIEPPAEAKPAIEVFSALIERERVPHRVVMEGRVLEIPPAPDGELPLIAEPEEPDAAIPAGPSRSVRLGELFCARSGDKGGDANLAVYGDDEAAYAFLHGRLTVEKLKELLPETASLAIERHAFPKLNALNFLIHDFLDGGVAQSLKPDPQAKGLGELLLSKAMEVPEALLRR
jgi:hypothetical protein